VAADLAELRAYLREWRRQTAQRQTIAAFIVMHDTTLDDLCEKRPTSLAELRQVFGFGVRKTELYGQEILEAFKQFREGARADSTQQKFQTQAAGSPSK
jgi:ATP-dependent DNA helicase RecQ